MSLTLNQQVITDMPPRFTTTIAASSSRCMQNYAALKGNCTGKSTFYFFLHHLVVLDMYSAAAKFQCS